MFYRTRGGDKVHYINDPVFEYMNDCREPVSFSTETHEEGVRELTLKIDEEKWEPVRIFNSGDDLKYGDDVWEQVATLYDYNDEYWLLRVRMVYLGAGKGNELPQYFMIWKGYFDKDGNPLKEDEEYDCDE